MTPDHLQAHFETIDRQGHAARLGMWLFLGTEVLLFGGLFVAYAFYRSLYAGVFERASRLLDRPLGTIETVVLITSSLTVALGLHAARRLQPRRAAALLVVTLLLGLAFLGIHAVEYAHEAAHHLLPGRFFHAPDLPVRGGALFFTLYFFMTGLHALHVTVGVGVLAVLGLLTSSGRYSADYDHPLELGAMYWHLVDVIWIFLYPLFYLL